MSRCLLLEAQLPKEMWTHAVSVATYIRNRCYSPRTGRTPFELLTGKKPDLSNMHTFGSVCYAYEQNKTKLDARCKKGVFVGYDRYSPAYLVYFADINDIKRCRCVKFIDAKTDLEVPEQPVDDFEIHSTPDDAVQVQGDENPLNHQGETGSRYPKRLSKPPQYLSDYCLEDSTKCNIDYCCQLSVVPKTYQEAISSDEAANWKTAMEEEMKSLTENDTFTVTQLPEGRTAVGGRWVYSVKIGVDGTEKFKARYVAKGYSQIQGIDYHDTFAPTAHITSVRVLLQIAVQYDLIVHQMDVKTAYLNAPIDCEIYVDQPEGFEVKSSHGKIACRLNKSLYGLKQSARSWNSLLHTFFVENGFTQSSIDTCVYIKHVDECVVIVLIWVDDIIVAASNDHLLCEVKNSLKNRFKMTDLGLIT